MPAPDGEGGTEDSEVSIQPSEVIISEHGPRNHLELVARLPHVSPKLVELPVTEIVRISHTDSGSGQHVARGKDNDSRRKLASSLGIGFGSRS